MNFVVDLWGQIRNEYKAAKLSMEAQKEALQAALLVLTAEVANAYFQIRIQDTQIDLLREIMDTRRNALDIQSSRFQGEVINYTDVAAARQALDAFEAQYDAAKMLRTLYENQIAVLIGSIPSEFTLEKNSLPIQAQPPRVPAGLPSEMLLRRPDLAQQERMMASYHALIGVAYASYFPALFLTADFGFRSPDWSHFLKESSKFWRIGADVSQFIFDAGKRKYQVELSWAEFRESADIYRQKVLIAFQEVEDSLSNLEWIAKGMESLKDAIAAAKTNYTIAADRYQLGVINYLDVTDTKLRELENQSAYLMLLGQQYGNTVQLIKALGGGWDSTGRKLEVRK
jgi:multidrug efflux system outer membrane protein